MWIGTHSFCSNSWVGSNSPRANAFDGARSASVATRKSALLTAARFRSTRRARAAARPCIGERVGQGRREAEPRIGDGDGERDEHDHDRAGHHPDSCDSGGGEVPTRAQTEQEVPERLAREPERCGEHPRAESPACHEVDGECGRDRGGAAECRHESVRRGRGEVNGCRSLMLPVAAIDHEDRRPGFRARLRPARRSRPSPRSSRRARRRRSPHRSFRAGGHPRRRR